LVANRLFNWVEPKTNGNFGFGLFCLGFGIRAPATLEMGWGCLDFMVKNACSNMCPHPKQKLN